LDYHYNNNNNLLITSATVRETKQRTRSKR